MSESAGVGLSPSWFEKYPGLDIAFFGKPRDIDIFEPGLFKFEMNI